MPETDQRSGADGRDTGRDLRRYFLLGQTALTGWALVAVLCLACVGTAMGAEPVPVVQGILVADSTEVSGSAPAVDPMAFVQVGEALNPAAPLDTVTSASPPLDTVTAASTPTGQIGPVPPRVLVGPTLAAPVGTIAPAGPAAQLRQAAFTSAAPDQRAGVAIQTAMAQLGLPYVWGGNGPTNGDAGFDCSGLTTFSYASAGVRLPRTAHTQYNAGPHVPDGAALQPGDLVFYGTSARVHHVGMYLGAGRMVNAPTFGKPVQVAFYRYRGDDYLGATRPAAAAGSLTEGVLPYVEPVPAPAVVLPPAQAQQQAQEQVFPAPTASLPAVLPQAGDPSLPSEKQSAAEAIADGDAEAAASGRHTVTGPSVPLKSDDRPATPVAGATSSSSAPTTKASAPAAPGTPTSSPTSTSTSTSTPTSTSTSTPAGASTSSSAPTSTPTASGSGTGPVGGATTTASSSTAAPSSPASTAGPASSSTAGPASSSTVEKATGSTTATSSLTPTRTATKTRTATTTVAASKTAVPVRTTDEPTSTSSKTKTVTSASKTVTSTSSAKDDDSDDTKSDTTKSDDSDDTSSKKATKTSSAKESKDSDDSKDSDSEDGDSKSSDSKDSDSKDSDSSKDSSSSKDSDN